MEDTTSFNMIQNHINELVKRKTICSNANVDSMLINFIRMHRIDEDFYDFKAYRKKVGTELGRLE